MALLTAVLMGCVFFPMLYVCVRSCLARTWPRLTAADKAVLTECAVSSLQGVLATWAGVTIVLNCNDVMYDRHWLADWYAGFCLPYFGYDIWAMYQSTSCQLASSGVRLPWATVLTNQTGGDTSYLAHMTRYCGQVSLTSRSKSRRDHSVNKLNMKETGLYYVNGFLILVTFFLCRIAIFPFMLWAYEQQYGHLLSDAPYRLPWKCSAGCAVVMTFQCYWFTKMLQIVHRTIRNKILQQM
ncbi:TRAM, LAG1 and CLN8 y domains-containing protein [Branchiostoma belcheri]|nr:TRAM, LAG1 and CLN8 y domains-containing protein [Branchiostoma belcheri]